MFVSLQCWGFFLQISLCNAYFICNLTWWQLIYHFITCGPLVTTFIFQGIPCQFLCAHLFCFFCRIYKLCRKNDVVDHHFLHCRCAMFLFSLADDYRNFLTSEHFCFWWFHPHYWLLYLKKHGHVSDTGDFCVLWSGNLLFLYIWST